MHVPAPFLWGMVLYRAWAAHGRVIYSDKTMASCFSCEKIEKVHRATRRFMQSGMCSCNMFHAGMSPRPMAHRTIALTTELMEPCRKGPKHISIILPFSWRGSFVRRRHSADIKTYRGAVGFWSCWWPFRRLGYTERASRLLFCGEGWLVGREQGRGKNTYRGAIGFWGWWPFRRPGYTERASRLLFLWWGMACRVWAGHRQKIQPWRNRILGLVAFQETWLHRTRFPAPFLWWGMACRAWAGQRQKILPWRNRILAFQETWLHRTRFPASFSVVRNGL